MVFSLVFEVLNRFKGVWFCSWRRLVLRGNLFLLFMIIEVKLFKNNFLEYLK